MHLDDDKYERIIRDWVYHRCCKRHKHVCGPPPKYVQEWCDWFVCICEGHSGEEDVPAPPSVVEWVNKTIEDPPWPTPEPGP